jgi:hypothetical protein
LSCDIVVANEWHINGLAKPSDRLV